jgi:Zn-dependent peptidase ImmA (M78 family)/transcriptional regulator with XRE-family HTH domain
MKKQETTTRAFNPELLTIVRKSMGMTQADLAGELGMKQSHISKIEAGLLSPPEEMMERLSDVTGYQKEFFFRDNRIFGISAAIIYHRKRQSIPIKVLDKIEAEVNLHRIHVEKLLRSVDANECTIPSYDPDESEGPATIAAAVRALWMMPSGPVKNLVQRVEDAGAIVIPYDFGTKKMDGLSQWLPPLPPIFFINKMIPGDRWRFSLAHELGHMVMHRMIPNPKMEDEADEFAAEFLMPTRDITPALRWVTLDKLAELKMYWKVSMQSLILRARDTGGITDSTASYLYAQMSKTGYRTREPIDIPLEQATMLQDIIEMYLNKLSYSVTDICEMLAINGKVFDTLYDSKKSHLRLAH